MRGLVDEGYSSSYIDGSVGLGRFERGWELVYDCPFSAFGVV